MRRHIADPVGRQRGRRRWRNHIVVVVVVIIFVVVVVKGSGSGSGVVFRHAISVAALMLLRSIDSSTV